MGTPLKPMMRLRLKEYVADSGSVFFSVNGLNSAMRSAWLNRRRHAITGFCPMTADGKTALHRLPFRQIISASAMFSIS